MRYIPNNKKRCQNELYKLMRCTSELNKSRIERDLPKRTLIEVAHQIIDLDYGDTQTLLYMLSNNMIPDIPYVEFDTYAEEEIYYSEEDLENYKKEIENEKKMTQAERIRLYALIHECPKSTARYAIFTKDATDKYPRKYDYKEKTKQKLLDKYNLKVIKDENAPLKFRVFQGDRELKLYKSYKNKTKYNGKGTPYWTFQYQKKTNVWSHMDLHVAVWLAFHGSIPKGYVVHHSKGNKDDNEHLELKTRPDHTKEHSLGHNQYNYNK